MNVNYIKDLNADDVQRICMKVTCIKNLNEATRTKDLNEGELFKGLE